MVLTFERSEFNRDIYELISGQNTNLLFVRLSKPISKYLLTNGVKYVIESWNNGERILFSGLIPISENSFKGNHKSFKKNTVTYFTVFISNDLKSLQILISNS